MNTLLIHLSDIHLKPDQNSFFEKKEKFIDAIKNKCLDKTKIFLIITGDIAFSGALEEYSIALDLINDIRTNIFDYCKAEMEIITIPGNHDCDFSNNNDIREIIQNSVKSKSAPITDEIIKNLTAVQEHYRYFENSVEVEESNSYKDEIFSIKKYSIGDNNINFFKFNTSWDSKRHEEAGSMNYPISNYIKYMSQEIGFNISLLHHPLNWQNPNDGRELKKALINHSTLILSGHEHTRINTKNVELTTQKMAYYIEADALQDSNNPTVSGFQTIDIDFKDKIISFSQFSWERDKYSSKNLVESFKDEIITSELQLDRNFAINLIETGINFTHSTADHVLLEDIYISPNLIQLFSPNKKHAQIKFNDKFLGSNNFVCIIGAESSGKTTLTKKIFQYYNHNGYIPILLRGSDINQINIEKINQILFKKFNQIYETISKDQYDQIDINKIVIIIDDFHTNKYSNEYKVSILNSLVRRYKNIYYTGNDIMQFELFLNNSEKSELTNSFNYFKIAECGPRLRHEIVSKWSLLGRSSRIEENDFLSILDKSNSLVNTLIGKNLVPSYPFFILCILQMEEAAVSTNAPSMHGYYYELLINNNLEQANINPDDIGFLRNFISNYCFFLFENRIRFNEISESDFSTFVNQFNTKYLTEENARDILNKLVAGKMLSKHNGNVSVKHKYIYYYYVASYLAKNITNEDVRNVILAMCKRLYREEYSNIILFITHLSNDSLILDELLKNTKECYHSFSEAKLEDDGDFINSLIKELPERIIAADIDSRSSRSNEIDFKDHQNQLEERFEEEQLKDLDYNLDDDINAIDSISYLNRTLKSIDLIGQIVKKYWGELDGTIKYELVKETYSAGLRVLNYLLLQIEGGGVGLIEYIRKLIVNDEDSKLLEKANVEKQGKKILFDLATMASFGIIKRVSDSIGHEKLINIFNQLEKESPSNAVVLINVAVELEHIKGFPRFKIKKYKSQIDKYFLSIVVLQKLVLNYLHLFNTSLAEKEQIASLTGIKVKDQRIISLTSNNKKDTEGL